ncbi:type II toxin-antitoxin system Phd/YefM family antitoxin [Pseudomonas sp. F1_0610]|uniref:type II toxin-antitoxin system Phd/YefM family antitoxin n=1 Tax=Pseudomonas sp. F1_0610 TaxID=3114284 RepID=UPI0039C3BDCF
MNIVTFSEARASLKAAMDQVCEQHTPTVITRQRGQHVVMLSLDDFNSMQETLHLMSSPHNASRLLDSLAQARSGQILTQGLIDESEKNHRD